MTKNDRIKAEILQAAESIFRQWGITKTTMEDIARQAGKGKSTLYYYFKSKEDILDAMAETQLARIIGLAQKETASLKTAKERILAFIAVMFREIQATVAPLHIEHDMATIREIIHRIAQKVDAQNEKALESILRFGVERKEFRSIAPRDIKPAARAIAWVIRSLGFNLFIGTQDKRSVDLIIRLLNEGF